MVRNHERRRAIADAGLRVLAGDGARGLTHRAVDREAGVPIGTTSNYARSREALVGLLVERIGERLTPDPGAAPDHSLGDARSASAHYLRDVVRRLSANRDVTLALFELRLECARRPELAETFSRWRRAGFEADVAFNAAEGLPGGREEIALFHYAVDGLLLDRLTVPLLPDADLDAVVDGLVEGLLPRSSS